jgi:hypothetical protein
MPIWMLAAAFLAARQGQVAPRGAPDPTKIAS